MGSSNVERSGGSWLEKYYERGREFAQFDDNVGFLYEPYNLGADGTTADLLRGWKHATANSAGFEANPAGELAGFRLKTAAATANGVCNLRSNVPFWSALATQHGYLAFRCKFSAKDNTTQQGVGLYDSGASNTVNFGYYPALNADNFVLQHSGSLGGSALNTGMAHDTSLHTVEIAVRGDGTLRLLIDDEDVDTITPGTPLTGLIEVWQDLRSGANGNARSIDMKQLLAMYETP